MTNNTGRRLATASSILILALALAGCSRSDPTKIGLVDPTPSSALGQDGYTAQESDNYLLRPSDVVSVTVFREPDLSLESIPIGADGNLSLPLIGSLKVQGMTAREVERLVTQRLADGQLKDPRVTINVMQFGSHVVTVEGSVEKPGMYPFKPGARLSGAVSLGGGPTRTANLRQVAVFRQTPQGIAVAKFDYAAVRAGTMLDPIIQPSDRVVVGVSGLSVFWQDLLKALPAFALFTQL